MSLISSDSHNLDFAQFWKLRLRWPDLLGSGILAHFPRRIPKLGDPCFRTVKCSHQSVNEPSAAADMDRDYGKSSTNRQT